MEDKEIIHRVYDTLAGNVEMDKFHPALPEIENQYVDTQQGYIYFEIDEVAYRLMLTRALVEKEG